MLKEIVQKRNLLHKINGVLFDLGVSSPLLDNPLRGFSFTHDGPLDMRMDNSKGMTAAEWLMSADEKDMARVLKTYGEEKFARKIARAVVAKRAEAAIATTRQLADLIIQAVPVRERDKHPATRSFQAIRIFINHELEELQEALAQALDVMAAGGRLAVISFHSLEDRIVKRFIRDQSRGDYFPPEIPVTGALLKPALKKIGKAIRPGSTEIDLNPRARSAILRVAEKIAA
jgi:16S rRNA (cytosine1402-N4)-methyltransferase